MRRLAIAPLLLAAAACGTSAGAPAALDGTVPSAPATTAPATAAPKPKPPAKPVAKPTASKPPARPVAKPTTKPTAQPPAAPAKGSTAGDVDGDGRRDTVRVTERANSLATGVWQLEAVLAGGRGTVTGVLRADPQVRPAILGVEDADRDGDGEVFVRVGGGASTTAYVAFALMEDGLAEVRTADGKALRLTVGGSVTHGDGFTCAGRDLYVLSVVSDDGETFRGTRTTYRWRGDRVDLVSKKSFTGKQGDPAVEKSYEIDCGNL